MDGHPSLYLDQGEPAAKKAHTDLYREAWQEIN